MRGRETSSEDAAAVQKSDGVLCSCRGMVVERGGLPWLSLRGPSSTPPSPYWVLAPAPLPLKLPTKAEAAICSERVHT